MKERQVFLVASNGATVTTARMTESGGCFAGVIDLDSVIPEILALFKDFEAAVNDQLYTEVDRLQDSIEALRLRARFEDGAETAITDLQIYPSNGEFSFRLAAPLPPTPNWDVSAGYPKGELRS